ncbi:MAG: biopolymer transporter ExbD [Nibricoccus sp.]
MAFKDPRSRLLTIPQQRAKIQLMSLVAILFFLFAVFAMFSLGLEKKTVIPLEWPGCFCIHGQNEHRAVVLQITDAGIYWDKALITERELPVALAKYVTGCKTPTVLLAGDERAKYGQTVAVLDEVRKAGIKNVIVETVYRRTGQ